MNRVSCFIGTYTQANGFKGIYCNNSGWLEGVGILLHTFYNNKERVSKLIQRGTIDTLGININCPQLPFNSESDLSICNMWNIDYKTSFTLADVDINPNIQPNIVTARNIREFDWPNLKYIYWFSGKRWMMHIIHEGASGRSYSSHNLDNLLSFEPKAVENYIKNNSEHIPPMYVDRVEENLRRILNHNKKVVSMSDIETCNMWLSHIELHNKVEFGYSETKQDGKNYAILQSLQQGKQKRKVLLRSKNINDLTLAICEQYGINPFARPIFGKESLLN